MAETRDNNMRFFHNGANGRKARNFISLNIDGSMIEDTEQIEKELVTSYNFLYLKQPLRVAWFDIWKRRPSPFKK